MDRKIKFLMDYFDLLVKENKLDIGTITPSDAKYLINELDKIEQDERTREFAV